MVKLHVKWEKLVKHLSTGLRMSRQFVHGNMNTVWQSYWGLVLLLEESGETTVPVFLCAFEIFYLNRYYFLPD